jgi:hypothetical protein
MSLAAKPPVQIYSRTRFIETARFRAERVHSTVRHQPKNAVGKWREVIDTNPKDRSSKEQN